MTYFISEEHKRMYPPERKARSNASRIFICFFIGISSSCVVVLIDIYIFIYGTK